MTKKRQTSFSYILLFLVFFSLFINMDSESVNILGEYILDIMDISE